MTTPQAALSPAYYEEVDWTDENSLSIRCYHCRAWNGYVSLAHDGSEVIGKTVHLSEELVNKGKPREGLPRYGPPDRVLRGKGPRSSRTAGLVRLARSVTVPLWLHCVECNRGQRLDVVLDEAIA